MSAHVRAMKRGLPKTANESVVQVTLNVNTTTVGPTGRTPTAGFGLVGTAVQTAGPVGSSVTKEMLVADARTTLSANGTVPGPALYRVLVTVATPGAPPMVIVGSVGGAG